MRIKTCLAALAIVALYSTSAVYALQDGFSTELTGVGIQLEAQYAARKDDLREQIIGKIPSSDSDQAIVDDFLESNELDAALVEFVLLHEATPVGLAKFAQQFDANEIMLKNVRKSPEFMLQMLVADGAKAKSLGRKGVGPAEYGQAIAIYRDIVRVRAKGKAEKGVLQRLAMAISLEHAVPIEQSNPAEQTVAPASVDPVKRYLHYEEAFLKGELDPAFEQLSTWELRMVVDGDEPDSTLAWGREMLRNFRPDHIYNSDRGWRYVSIVTSDVKYGSGDVKYDLPELQKYQNILMNGGVCGRRAFFGRFILRAFGIPTTARPSRGHAALAHWTPEGWVVNLGGAWGCGWTKTRYDKDVDFLASTQARSNPDAFLQVKRAQWIGDVVGEKRAFGESADKPEFWNATALRKQREIIEDAKAVTLGALGEDLGEANEPTVAEKILASPVTESDRRITFARDGVITISAAAYSKPSGNTREVIAMKSFGGGLQVFLPRFFPQGQTVLRGGTWKGEPDACTSGKRLLSGGYGKYENWGLRAAVSYFGKGTPKDMTLDLGDGISMEMVYIPPGKFMMGGESTTDGRFQCVEVPKHEVELTKGFYLGKYEVTQAQYQAILGTNPSKSTKGDDCPVDNVGEDDALNFCGKLAEKTGLDVRLPTEAQWEYASRGGKETTWFFGQDPNELAGYAWYKANAGAKSHPVGQKKPNPFGLYDIYGNVCERISDKYSRSYYSQSPKQDPTGPSQGTKSRLEYQVEVERSGNYLLSAEVVTPRAGQQLKVAVNKDKSESVLELPFTVGIWGDSKPVTIKLTAGTNTLRFWRDQPPQYGIALKHFTLQPLDN